MVRQKIILKIDANKFGILLTFFTEYEINYFSKLPKSKKFLLLTRVLLTMKAYVNFEREKVLLL